MPFLNVSEAARKIGADPRDISSLFYNRTISDEAAPIVGGRRMIPDSLVWLIESKLQAAGKLKSKAVAHGK